MKTSALCVCGHMKSEHWQDKIFPNMPLPLKERSMYGKENPCFFKMGFRYCKCANYKQDNLRDLEQQYKEKLNK